ncbi:hypothetical protein DFH09DRAFT_1145780 [Mycena vulgaris]|nr:hypothetical protein DFH09DRAFT_1145780 [Mycena vulgaris]
MSRPPGLYHRLAWVLSLLYIVFGLTAIYMYGFEDGVGTFHSPSRPLSIFCIGWAIITLGMLSKLVPYTTRIDETVPFSRVGKHHTIIGFLLGSWSLPALRIFLDLAEHHSSILVSKCLADRFLTPKCIPIGMDVVLPIAIVVTLTCASRSMYYRAVSRYGTENVPLPAHMPHPANFFPFQTYPPGSELPAWMLAHIAEIESDDAARGRVELV